MTIARLVEGRNAGIIRCDADSLVSVAIALLAKHRIGALPVFSGGRIAGIFSERDVVYRLAGEGPGLLEKRVGEVMSAPAITVDKAMPVLDALALMTERRIRHLPVLDGEAVCGFVSIGDLVKYRIEHIQFEAEAMRSYIQSA